MHSGKALLAVTGLFHSDGGIASVNRLVAKSLLERGNVLDVLALSECQDTIDPRYGGEGFESYQAFRGNKVRFAVSVWQHVFAKDYDVIMVDHVNLASILAPLAGVGIVNYVVWLHGIEVFPPKPDTQGSVGLRYAWRRIASSQYTRERVQSRYPDMVINACDLSLDPVRHPMVHRVQSRRPSRGLSLSAVDGSTHLLGQRVVLHVSRMVSSERYKGQESLLRAFPIIKNAFPDAQLVLVGQGDDKPRLLSMARDLDPELRGGIFMPGYVEDEILGSLYDLCFAFAMPSTGEGFGLVYLEAMSHGKPCIGGRTDAAPYVVLDAMTGILVNDPTSPTQVADSIIRLLTSPEKARELGMAGYKRVCSQYLFTHFKERFLRILEG